MHKLRASLRHEQHPFLAIATKVATRYGLNPDGQGFYVTIGPADVEFRKELSDAGISTDPDDFTHILDEDSDAELARIQKTQG